MTSVKGFLKSVLPLPAERQREEFAEIKAKLQEQGRQLAILTKEMTRLREALSENTKQFADIAARDLKSLRKTTAEIQKDAAEIVWAEIFDDAVKGSTWMGDASYSPGRWGVGYPYLYAMYRTLNDVGPKKILELGLGQSTRMLGRYAASHEDVEHTVVEHDEKWIDFFSRDFSLPPNSRIVRLDIEFVPYKEAASVRTFKGFKEKFAGEKFDFISIDAPLGGDMKGYSRIDVLQSMPDILAPDFVLMIDDLGRKQEQNTANEMLDVLKSNGIPFKVGEYRGKKDCMLICAESLGFLATL